MFHRKNLFDIRLGKVSGHRVPVDTMMEVLELFDTRYFDFTAKHFHDKLVSEHGFRRRHHYVKAMVRVHEYPDGHLAVFHGPRRLAVYNADGTSKEETEKQAA